MTLSQQPEPAASLTVGQAMDLAVKHHRQGEPARSATLCKRILEAQPAHPGALMLMALLLYQDRQPEPAAEMLERAIEADPGQGEAHSLLVRLLMDLGRLDEARAVCVQALKRLPRQVELWERLGDLLVARKRHKKAASCYRRAMRLNPAKARPRHNLACALRFMERNPEAERHWRRVVRDHPEFLPARIALVDLLDKQHRLEEALQQAERGLAMVPDDPNLSVLAAKCERRLGMADEAIARLEAMAPGRCHPRILIEVHNLLGKLYDAREDSERAFEHFTRSNRLAASMHPGWERDRQMYLAEQTALAQVCALPGMTDFRPPPMAESEPCPVFLVGFPRSGTTLLEQVLHSHSRVQTLDERNSFSKAMLRINAKSAEQYCQRVMAMTAADMAELREIYWKDVNRYLTLEPGQILVDKLPLNLNMAGIIWHLFPRTSFILALRHPLDCCLSSFMQYFYHNRAMSNCYRMEDVINLYRRSMAIWCDQADRLPLRYFPIRYEDLVSDFGTQARRLVEFLGLDWEPGIEQFHHKARQRRQIRTPSYDQVTRPIYQEAVFRWERYQEQVGRWLPALMPFIKRFGYDRPPAG